MKYDRLLIIFTLFKDNKRFKNEKFKWQDYNKALSVVFLIMSPSLKTLYLLDISSLFFRSYYAISLHMKNKEGLPTNALYGVLRMLYQLGTKKSPDYLISCFDSKGPSFRKDLYQDYKANRQEIPEDLEVQIPYLKTMMDKLLIPYWEKSGFEADDLIASLANSAKKHSVQTYIVSSDKDFAQIVSSDVYLYDTMKDIVYDPDGIKEKWGISPHQMRDYQSLVGDSSDNIPGVKGIGPKGAIELLKVYGSLEDIYNNIEKITGSSQKKLLQSKEQAFLSRELVTLKQDIVWEKPLEEAKYKRVPQFSQQSKQALKDFLEELSFKSFIRSFFPIKTESPRPVKNSWQETQIHFAEAAQGENLQLFPQKPQDPPDKSQDLNFPLLKGKQVTVEMFKKTLPPYAQLWLGSYKDQFYMASGKSFTALDQEQLSSLAGFLDEKWVRFLGHDLKFFWHKLEIKHPIAEWDSMIAGHLLLGEVTPSFRSLCKTYLNIPEDESLSLPQVLYQEQVLYKVLTSHIKEQDMENLFQTIELPLIAVLYDMEKQGVSLDLKELAAQSQSLDRDIKNLESQIYKLLGREFNISSPKQLASVLFEQLGLPKGRKTKTGYSTDSYELMKIKHLHPVLPCLLEHRELFKLKSTYTDSLISLRDEKTGRVYTEFKQAVTATGRLSSVNPNLQNIPIRTERGRRVRKAFVARKGYNLISADYSQLELRILAHITEDPCLCRAFERGEDIHASTASEVFNVPLKEVSSDLRRKSKAINFGIAYGQGVYGLAENLSIPRSEAKEIIDNYFKRFKKIKEYIESVKKELPQKGYIRTLYGRKRVFLKGDLRSPRLKAMSERMAINTPLQGTASELVKKL